MKRGELVAAMAALMMTAGALIGGALPAVAQADSGVSISATPGLQPAFDPVIPNYTTSCEPGESVTVNVTDTDGASVSVAGQSAQTSSFQAQVPLTAGHRFTIVVGSDTY